MDKQRINELRERYAAGTATPDDLAEIERLLENGQLDLGELPGLDAWEQRIARIDSPIPSPALDDAFHTMLAGEQRRLRSSFEWRSFFSWPVLAPRLAFATVALIAGVTAGYWMRPGTPTGHAQISQLSDEVTELKEMMMLSLLEKESATERLRAVNLTQEMTQASHTVTTALIETLNNDSNVNVRLAALDALKPYTGDSQVREALIRSIAQQESPLVQVSLAELMAAIQARSSVEELQKILKDQRTPADVKKKIRETIQVLI